MNQRSTLCGSEPAAGEPIPPDPPSAGDPPRRPATTDRPGHAPGFPPARTLARLSRRLAGALAALLVLTGRAQETAPPTEAAVTPPAAERAVADLTLEELIELKVGRVYAASRYSQEIARAPSRVSILTSEEIKLHGHRNLSEALRSMPGLSVAYDRNYSYLSIGGFARGDHNSHVLVLIDGHRVNDYISGSALLGNDFPLDIDLIDRIEVTRGPGSSVYGNNAFFGVINVITRTGRQIDGAEVSGEAGSFDSYKGRFSAGKMFENGLEVLFSGSYFDSAGPENLFYKEYNSPASNRGRAHQVDGENAYSFFTSTSWRDLTLEGGYNHRDKVIPTGSYSTVFNNPRNRTLEERAFASLQYEHGFGEDWDLLARVHYDYSRTDGDYLYAVTNPPPQFFLNVDRFQAETWGIEGQLRKRLWDRHSLTLGTELHDSFRQDARNYNVNPRALFLNDQRSAWNWGVYAQGEIALLTNLTFTPGLRFDHGPNDDRRLNPRLALVYAPTPETALKLIYGTAYRSPNPIERYYNDGNLTTKSNPDLKPETITSYQVVWRQLLPQDLRLTLTGFHYNAQDLISYATDPNDGLLHSVNLDRVKTLGGEVDLEKHWSSGLRLNASYTYQNAVDARTDDWLPRSPRHLAKLNLAVPLWSEKIFAAAELQYVGDSLTLSHHQDSGYWVANLTLYTRQLLKGLEFSASVYNLFDRDYSHPAGFEHRQDVIAQDGRTFRVKLTYRF